MTPFIRIRKARINLLLDEPFFGTLMMRLKPIEDKATKRLSTNGRDLRFNPDWVAPLSDLQLKTGLAHEVLHCGLLHPFRRGARDLKKFNRAADYAINNFLDNYIKEAVAKGQPAPFTLKGPDGEAWGLLDHSYDGLSAEEIYARLAAEPPPGPNGQQQQQQQGQQQQGQGAGQGQSSGKSQPGQGKSQPGQAKPQPGNGTGQGQGQGASQGAPSAPSDSSAPSDDGPGEFTDGAADPAQAADAEADWKVALQQAALGAKGQGRLPACMERFIEELLHPEVPWTEALRTFITSTSTDDYSWVRPNRRYTSGGIILPSLRSPHLGPVIFAVDTSGSISQKTFTRFISEGRAVLFDCRPAKFILAQCDAAVQAWDELDLFAGDDAFTHIKFQGGGGTSFCPVFDRALDEFEPPAVLVYLTDLYGTFPEEPPPFPVLWVSITPDQSAPFGHTIYIKED